MHAIDFCSRAWPAPTTPTAKQVAALHLLIQTPRQIRQSAQPELWLAAR